MCTLHFVKPRGGEAKEVQQLAFEDFIAPKGIKAIGNQLTAEKLKHIEANEPLPYTPAPKTEAADLEAEVEEVKPSESDDSEGQISLEL